MWIIGSPHAYGPHRRRQGSVLEASPPQALGGRPDRARSGRVAPSREQPVQARGMRRRVRAPTAGPPWPPRGASARSSSLTAASSRTAAADLAGDPGLHQPDRDGPASLPLGREQCSDHGAGERLVVDQTDHSSRSSSVRTSSAIEAGPFQPTLELPPAALPHREQPKRPLVHILVLARPRRARRGTRRTLGRRRTFPFCRLRYSARPPRGRARPRIGRSSSSENPVRPTASRTFRSISSRRSMCSARNARAFSLPWPSCSPS